MTRAMPQKRMSPEEFTGEVQNAAATFADGGALTMRLGRIMTGTNPGGYMLGVSYPSLDAVIENCDLIITSDTSVAHLAGALGARTWVMLQFTPDWRWSISGSDCLWYPSLELFRQEEPGDWESLFDRIKEALLDLRNSA